MTYRHQQDRIYTYLQTKEKATLTGRLECFHNGIILIVI